MKGILSADYYFKYNNFTLPQDNSRVLSFLRITDKFEYISFSHFSSALVIGSGRQETLDVLYLLFC